MTNLNIVKIEKVKMLHCNYTQILNYHNQMKEIMTKFSMRALPIPIPNYAKSHMYPSKLPRYAVL